MTNIDKLPSAIETTVDDQQDLRLENPALKAQLHPPKSNARSKNATQLIPASQLYTQEHYNVSIEVYLKSEKIDRRVKANLNFQTPLLILRWLLRIASWIHLIASICS